MTDIERFRLFIAVTIPEKVKAKIAEAQAELRRALPDRTRRCTKREPFHLTLTFLGNVDAPRVEALEEALRAACHGFSALRLSARGIGFFPDLRFPRVAWVRVSDQANQLARLQQAVEVSTREFTPEEPDDGFTGRSEERRVG